MILSIIQITALVYILIGLLMAIGLYIFCSQKKIKSGITSAICTILFWPYIIASMNAYLIRKYKA